MKTKIFFAMLVVVIVLSVTVAITGASAPGAKQVQNVSAELAPVAADSTEPRLWSGSISLSDNNSPDRTVKIKGAAGQKPLSACMSEDSQPRRQGGCVE